MILEYLEELYRQQAAERLPANPFRASAMGHCIRKGCFDLLGLVGEPLQPRRVAVFRHGTIIHHCLTEDLKHALGWRFVDEKKWGDTHCEIDGVRIGFHIDGAFQDGDSIGIIEIKSMSDFAFEKAQKGIIDHEYLCQAWTYFKGTNFNPVVFVCYRKETSAMVEIVFDRNESEKVVTQRFNSDPVEIFRNEPLLVTEIKTPFDLSVEDYVRERIKWLKTTQAIKSDPTYNPVNFVRETVPGADGVEDEVEKVQGKEKYYARAAEILKAKFDPAEPTIEVEKNGSWYSFKTGRQILKFPCSYCQHKSRCYPKAKLEMKKDRPIWVI